MKAQQIEQNDSDGKLKNQIVFEDSSQNNQEKLTLGIEDSSYLDNRQEISNANIQINTLTNMLQFDQLKNTTTNFHNLPTSSQLVINLDEKYQVEGKNKKNKKSLPDQMGFQSFVQFLKQYNYPKHQHNFRQYSKRRIQDYFISPCRKIDLGVYNLREVVTICVTKKLISNSVMLSFVSGRDILDEEKFVAQLNNKKFQNLGMEKNYFTPFDHRLLSTLLIGQFPHQFQFRKNPLIGNSNLTVFYSFLYQLSEEKYEEIIEFLNTKYNRDWLPNNLTYFAEQCRIKIEKKPDINVQQSFPLHMPPRKLRKNNSNKI